jgi:hypothetical protein
MCKMTKSKTFGSHQYSPSLLGTVAYYCQRLVVNRLLRDAVVYVMGKWIGQPHRKDQVKHEKLPALLDDGIVRLEEALSDTQCAEILSYLADKPVSALGLYRELDVPDTPVDQTFGIYRIENVLDCPHIMELVSSPKIVNLASDYLGCIPSLTCLGVQWSYPTSTPGIPQQFHRDSEGWKYLRFLVYLTDVDEGCGPHVYVKCSHKGRLPFRMKFYQLEEIAERYGRESVVKVFGKRGTGIAADTCGIHKGEAPTIRPRLVLNFTYAISPNTLHEYKPLHTRHSPQLTNYRNRLFLR